MKDNRETRREQIKYLLIRNEEMKVNDLAAQLNVTPETIRTDLDFLERRGFLFRRHGSALLRTTDTQAPMEIRIQENPNLKREISEAVFPFVKDGMVLYISSSSTVIHLCRMLVLRKDLTVFTSSLDIAEALIPTTHKIIMLGGTLDHTGRRIQSGDLLRSIHGVHFDLSILGMSGCKNTDGPASPVYEDLEEEKYIMSHSEINLLVADHTKFQIPSPYQYAKFTEFDAFICDRIPEEYQEKLNGVRVIECE